MLVYLAGLALGVGMLADNSIVVIENIYRLRHEGKTSMEAAIEGAEVSGAIWPLHLHSLCGFTHSLYSRHWQLFADMGLTIALPPLQAQQALTLFPLVSYAERDK